MAANAASALAMEPHHRQAQATTLIPIAISPASVTGLTGQVWPFAVAASLWPACARPGEGRAGHPHPCAKLNTVNESVLKPPWSTPMTQAAIAEPRRTRPVPSPLSPPDAESAAAAPMSLEGLPVAEEDYWRQYYLESDVHYEWNNGRLEEKPVSDYETFLVYQWFMALLAHFLTATPRGTGRLAGAAGGATGTPLNLRRSGHPRG